MDARVVSMLIGLCAVTLATAAGRQHRLTSCQELIIWSMRRRIWIAVCATSRRGWVFAQLLAASIWGLGPETPWLHSVRRAISKSSLRIQTSRPRPGRVRLASIL